MRIIVKSENEKVLDVKIGMFEGRKSALEHAIANPNELTKTTPGNKYYLIEQF